MNKLGDKYWRALKPDAQAFDEIRFVTIPRYKVSGLSGDEWRISVTMQFFRKGKLIWETWAGHEMQQAMGHAYSKYGEATDNGQALFCGEDEVCDQEGCPKEAVVTYQLKHEYCRDGHQSTPTQPHIRKFCEDHKKRGDCGLEDADDNYIDVTHAK